MNANDCSLPIKSETSLVDQNGCQLRRRPRPNPRQVERGAAPSVCNAAGAAVRRATPERPLPLHCGQLSDRGSLHHFPHSLFYVDRFVLDPQLLHRSHELIDIGIVGNGS
jgi:hypothetical protein